ncbi:MAG: hypothetical protein N2C14_08670 [Planctomycetales bacterium]
MKAQLAFALLTALAPLSSLVMGQAAAPKKPTVLLQYKFRPGERVAWEVVHEVNFDMTVNGVTQEASTWSKSEKAWKVMKTEDSRAFTVQNIVESVHMKRRVTGRADTEYNSLADREVPPGFENVAVSLGRPLSLMRFNLLGKLIARRDAQQAGGQGQAESSQQLLVPLPSKRIPVGHVWSLRHEFPVKMESGVVLNIKARDRFELTSLRGDVATIAVVNQVLTPIEDPAVEAKLIHRIGTGTVEFSVRLGRPVMTRMEADKTIVGVRGKTSSLHYKSNFTERLLPARSLTARPPKTGSQPKSGPGLKK